jgi:hypothetical protein
MGTKKTTAVHIRCDEFDVCIGGTGKRPGCFCKLNFCYRDISATYLESQTE